MSNDTSNNLPEDIARQILIHLRQIGAKPGLRLTERKLAKQFDVSRSPVRIALNLLSEQGILESSESGSRHLKVDQRELVRRVQTSSTNPIDKLNEQIAIDRISNNFPETFTEADLLRRYNVTRGLLLKALNQMAAEGLIERRKGHGWKCLPIINSPESNYFSYEFRKTIEPAALLSDRFTVDEVRLQRCYNLQKKMAEGQLTRMSQGEVFDTNADFHQMLADFSGNPFFQEAIRKQNQLRLILEKRAAKHSTRMVESCHEHMNIMEAIMQGNQKAASELMSYHLTKASRSFLGLSRTEPAVSVPGED